MTTPETPQHLQSTAVSPVVPRPATGEPGAGPGEFLTRWLIVRRPARLVVDGLIVLAAAGAAYLVWVTLAYPDGAMMPPVETTRLQRTLLTLVSSAFYALWYLGVTLIVFGCVRQLADALRRTVSDRV
jgi:predicted small integral membrane protein